MLSEHEIKSIKDYYSNKKKEFANRKTYYSDESIWGDTYGFDLSDPYTLDEIEKYETYYKIKLDQNFKIYLTQISKELFVYAYPLIFDISVPSEPYEPYDPSKSSEVSNKTDNNDDDSEEDEYLCRTIGIGGCAFTHRIYLNGAKSGTIWYDDSDSMMHIHDNFKEYITEELIRNNILNDDNKKYTFNFDLKTLSEAYVVTRILAGYPLLRYNE